MRRIRGWRKGLLPSSLFLILILAILFDSRGEGAGDPLHRIISLLSSPIQNLFSSAALSIGEGVERYILLQGMREENELLKREIRRLEMEVLEIIPLRARLKRLESILNFREERRLNLMGVRVIANNSDRGFRGVRIDAGSSRGVSKGLPVVGAGGALGYVVRVTANSSDILLVTDPRCRISVELPDAVARGISRGNGDLMEVRYIKDGEGLREGIPLFTSGMDGIFPPGIPVGIVAHLRRGGTGPFIEVKAKPLFEMKDLYDVAVIMGTDGDEKGSGEDIW